MKSAILIGLMLCATWVWAKEAPPVADDLALEKRVLALAAELRCLVCQNQTIADSHAELAIDLKNQVREQMRAGKNDDEIRAYMVARYGDFVLYNPPVKPTTMLLWVGPFVLLASALLGLLLYLRNRRGRSKPQDLTEDQRSQAHALLSGGDEPRT
jgi:cytochrome c-type biogenesis protein CcmH